MAHEGLLIYAKNIYKFQHDGIQEAVYSIIPLREKSKIHYRIGNYFYESPALLVLYDKDEKYKNKTKAIKNQKKLKKWAKHAPI